MLKNDFFVFFANSARQFNEPEEENQYNKRRMRMWLFHCKGEYSI